MPVLSNVFCEKPIYKILQALPDGNVRSLTSRRAIARKMFCIALSIILTTYARNGLKELQCEQTFIVSKISLVLKKNKCCLNVENILVIKFVKAVLKK